MHEVLSTSILSRRAVTLILQPVRLRDRSTVELSSAKEPLRRKTKCGGPGAVRAEPWVLAQGCVHSHEEADTPLDRDNEVKKTCFSYTISGDVL